MAWKDDEGKIQPPSESPKSHKFGNFKVPEDCHIKGFSDFPKPSRDADWWTTRDRSATVPHHQRGGA